jgi:hypothetical protein
VARLPRRFAATGGAPVCLGQHWLVSVHPLVSGIPADLSSPRLRSRDEFRIPPPS